MPETVNALLRRALDLVADERPDAYAAITGELDGLRLSASFEDTLRLESRDGALQALTPDSEADIRLTSSRTTVLDLVHGRTTLNAAVRDGRLEVAGSIPALRRCMSAAEYFAGALLRIRSSERLLEELEEDA